MKTKVGMGMCQVCLPEMYKPWIQSQHLNTEVKLTAHSAGFIAEFISSKSQEKMEIVPILQRAEQLQC